MVIKTQAKQNPIASLRKQWLLVIILSVTGLFGGFFLLQVNWQPDHAYRWLSFAFSGFVALSWLVWSHLSYNYRTGDDRLLPTFGAGNVLTIFRGALIALLLGFLSSPRPDGWLATVPGFLFTLAAVSDLFDGYLARIKNHTTRLGEILDLQLDGAGVLIASFLAIRYGQVPVWFFLIGIARYLFVAGIWLRQRLGKPVYELSESASRRPFAGALMGFLAVVLWPLFSPPGTHLAAVVFAAPFLVGFAWDWLAVSCEIKPLGENRKLDANQPEKPRIVRDQGKLFSWLPLLLRAVTVALVAIALSQRLPGYFHLLRTSSSSVSANPNWLVVFILLLGIIGSLMLAFGAAGRAAALAILFSIGLHQQITNLTPLDFLIIIGAATLFFLGTGAYSLWKPEDTLIRHRLGEV